MLHEIDCNHVGALLGTRWMDTRKSVGVYVCNHPEHAEAVVTACVQCPHRQSLNPDVSRAVAASVKGAASVSTATASKPCSGCGKPSKQGKPAPPVQRIGADSPIVDRWGKRAGLEDAYMGGHVFLTLGGPSLNLIDWSWLTSHRGVITFGVNNVGAYKRTNMWTMGDKISKFSDAIWQDPAILKFVPYPKLNKHVRTKDPTGFRLLPETCRDMPGVIGILRNSTFDPDTWLFENTINWGNGKDGASKNGLPRVLSTFIQAVRLCYLLGFRHVYLLGCDFTMANDYMYSFPQDRHGGAVGGNNNSYVKITKLFELLQPRFLEARFHVFNANPASALKVFPTLSLEEAVAEAIRAVPQEPDLAGWYEQE